MTCEQKTVLELTVEIEMAKSVIMLVSVQNIEFSSARVMVEEGYREAIRKLGSIAVCDTISIPKDY